MTDENGESVPGPLDASIQGITNVVVKQPLAVVVVLLLITLYFFQPATEFKDNMKSDLEIFLPEDEEASEIVREVRAEGWSTDILVVYIETPNARATCPTTTDCQQYNITQRHYLQQMSQLEGDDVEYTSKRSINHNRTDRGADDGIIFALSISMIIKTINSTPPSMFDAVEDEVGFIDLSDDDEAAAEGGKFSIPGSQEEIDSIVDQISSALKKLVIDTNEDGIWDTAVVLLALHKDRNQQDMIESVDEVIDWVKNDHREQEMEMIPTGIVVVLRDITDQIYNDLIGTMIPFAVLFVILFMVFMHRNPKIILIVGGVMIMTLIWTFGALRIAGESYGLILTPMIVATGPILIGISVDDALHVANRIEEKRKELGAEHDTDGWEFYTQSVAHALKTSGGAIFLTTITTLIGFSVLLGSNIMPMRTVAWTMIFGMGFAFLITVLLVPAIIQLTHYQKGPAPIGISPQAYDRVWRKVGAAPVRWPYPFLAIVAAITLVSLVFFSSVLNSTIRGDESGPENIPSYNKIVEYSEKFQSGQTQIIIARGDPAHEDSIKQLDALDQVDAATTAVGEIKIPKKNPDDPGETQLYQTAFSIVDFLKSIRFNATVYDPVFSTVAFPIYQTTAWEFLHDDRIWCDSGTVLCATAPMSDEQRDQVRQRVLNIFFNSLTAEVNAMFNNEDDTKTLIYTEMPYVAIDRARQVIKETNEAMYRGVEPPPEGSFSNITGGAPITVAINDGIHATQDTTTRQALMLVAATLFVIYILQHAHVHRGTKMGWLQAGMTALRLMVLTMIPILIVVAWQPLTMVGGSVNVNIFTAMVGTITIGIGIDFSIHVAHRAQEEGETPHGTVRAIETTGKSIFEGCGTTIAGLMAGFLITFKGLENFFMMVLLLITYAFFAAAFVLPALYTAQDDVKWLFQYMVARSRGEPPPPRPKRPSWAELTALNEEFDDPGFRSTTAQRGGDDLVGLKKALPDD